MIRTMTCVLALALSSLSTATAQRLTEFAPIEWSIRAAHVPDAGATTLLVGLARVVPVYTLLPQTTAGSQFRMLDVRIGARSHQDEMDVRYRFNALSFTVQRTPQHVYFTALDINRSGSRESDVTWIQIGYGPAASRTFDDRQITLRSGLHVGLVSTKLGTTVFSAIPQAGSSDSAVQAGVSVAAFVKTGATLDMGVNASYSVHTMNGDLRHAEIRPVLSWYPVQTIAVSVAADWFRTERFGRVVTDMEAGISIAYTPKAVRF